MTNPQITTDLSKVLEQINSKLDTIQKDVTDIKIELTATKGEINTLRTELKGEIKTETEKLSGQIKALDEKTTGLGKRLENQEFVSRSIVVALVITILGGFAKLFGVIGNP